ncbi:MAG: SHOCT domain-containing protein [Deltaproteobacteria bacterium]|nr:SHOCT domain-containing protein [Deltaproteobacteria bacterium]
MFKKKKAGDGIFKSILAAYAILILHVLLIAGMGLMVIFFRGIIQYMLWIFLGGTAFLLGSGYYFYRRMKAGGRTLRETLQSPLLNGRAVEISFLGGVASVKLGRTENRPVLDGSSDIELKQLDDPGSLLVKELNELARLLEDNLIPPAEYNQAKQQFFKS